MLGKIVGGLLGLSSARWYLVLLGVLAGHQFDRGFANRSRHAGVAIDRPFVGLLFALLGQVAKADGQVSEAEIRAARKLMHTLKLGVSDTRYAMDQFRRGKEPSFQWPEAVQSYFSGLRNRAETKTLMIQLLLGTAIDASALNQKARSRIWQISQALGISRVEIAQLEAVIRAQRSFSQSSEGRVDKDRLASAYALLGVDPAASDRDVKKAYRRLMSKHHPDKIAGEKPSQSVLEKAGQKTQKIIKAYELIRQRRGLR